MADVLSFDADGASAPVPAKPAAPAAPEALAAADPLSQNVTRSSICWLSPICSKKPYPKSKFCTQHKKDAEALKKDAERSGYLDFYNAQCLSQALYSKMLMEYLERCQSRGHGIRRERFDWAQYQERCYRLREVRRGSKDVMRLGWCSVFHHDPFFSEDIWRSTQTQEYKLISSTYRLEQARNS